MGSLEGKDWFGIFLPFVIIVTIAIIGTADILFSVTVYLFSFVV